jgi:hypothetical protein
MQHRFLPMSPWKTEFEVEDHGAGFARRIREVRVALFGELGVARLAELVGVPCQTWNSYEAGVAMPAVVALRFLATTRLNPEWLLSGDGPRYLVRHPVYRSDGPN